MSDTQFSLPSLNLGSPRGDARFEVLVQSFGAGQDSTAILYRWLDDPDFRAQYQANRVIVVVASTGRNIAGEWEEHPHTIEHIDYCADLCRKADIPFFHIVPEWGYHRPSWSGLTMAYRQNDTVGSPAFIRSCTDNLKIQVIYNFVDDWLAEQYNLPGKGRKGRGKKAIQSFAKLYGRLGMTIGIAADEVVDRFDPAQRLPAWQRNSVERLLPLVDLEWNRADCQQYMASTGRPVPWPSNCMLCHFMSKVELVWLYRFHRHRYDELVELEQNKLTKFANQPRNLGVFGVKTVPEVLAEALEQYGHWSDDQLNEYKFSHGHCIKSRY